MVLDQQWLSVVLEEYKALRSESLAAMANQQSMLRLGATAISIALVFSTNENLGNTSRYLLFAVIIPLFTLFFFTLYAIEFARMVRVGRYTEAVEAKINQLLLDRHPLHNDLPPLGWEGWLNTVPLGKKKPPRLPYYAVVPVSFLLVTLFSTGVALSLYNSGPFDPLSNVVMTVLICIIVLVVVGSVSLRLRDLREEYDPYFSSNTSIVRE